MERVLFTLMLAIMFFTACKKEDQPDPPTQYMPQELKDYMLFKKNSYWLYQDSASGALDSVVVTADSSFIYTFRDREIIYSKHERYTINTYSFLFNLDCVDMASARCHYAGYTELDFCYIIVRTKKDNTTTHNDLGSAYIFYFFPIVGTKAYSLGSYVSVGAKYDSLQILGKYYPKVVRMDDTGNGTEGGWPTRFYFSKNHGIIRKEINYATGRQVWNLVRSELLQ